MSKIELYDFFLKDICTICNKPLKMTCHRSDFTDYVQKYDEMISGTHLRFLGDFKLKGTMIFKEGKRHTKKFNNDSVIFLCSECQHKKDNKLEKLQKQQEQKPKVLE